MKSALIASALLAAASAGPISKRFTIQSEDASTVGASDAAILTYALVLEHLEDAFYRGGLQNFTAAQFAAAGFDAAFYANLEQVAQDEANHVAFLTAGLTAVGATPPAECVYSVSPLSHSISDDHLIFTNLSVSQPSTDLVPSKTLTLCG